MKNKRIKKITSTAIALTIGMGTAFSCAVPALANEREADTITISVPETDSHSYSVYQIFTGDYDTDTDTLSNVIWGANGTGTEGTRVTNAVLSALEALKSDTYSDADQLAEIQKYVDLSSDAVANVDKTHTATVAPGYYLIKDADTISGNDSYTIYIVKVGGDMTISRKSSVPTIDKTVLEDSTGTYGEGADYAIGDDVTFRLSGTIADNYGEYKAYKYQFADTLSDGLTFNDDVVVKIDGNDYTSEFTVTKTGQTVTITCNDLKGIKDADEQAVVTAESEIVVTYTAELNSSAAIGSIGNPNTAKLVFSNNPNQTSTGTAEPGDGETPSDEVKVYTYQLVINKLNEEQEALAGAGFTLYEKQPDGTYKAIGSEVTAIAEEGSNVANVFKWSGLDAGDYKLVETTTPAGYNTIDDVEFNIVSTIATEAQTENGISEGDLINLTSSLENANVTVSSGTVTGNIVNVPGTKLPTTGTMGIIMLMGGVVIVLGGAYGIRMKSAKKSDEE
ncbi:MAG: SpaH/EbpB family LPXTG-anchored major pilin [Coprococcus sp.]